MAKKPEEMTPEELVKYYVFPHGLSEEEKKEAEREMRDIRMRLLHEMTETQRLYGDLIRFRLEVEQYIQEGQYTPEHSFGSYLKEYIRLIKKQQKSFADDIRLHPTKLSRILNDREDPNIPLMYRLEKHSGRKIPALLWWKILMKKIEHEIDEDIALREEEEAKVDNELQFDSLSNKGKETKRPMEGH